MTAYELRSYPGAAADTTLAAPLNNTALTFTVATGDGVNYPDGTGGPFFMVIDYDVAATEKVYCTSRTADTFTIDAAGRGADGTTAVAHGVPAKVRACWTATDAQESNVAAHNTVGKVTTKGDQIVATGAAAFGRVAVGSDGNVWIADSSQTTGARWGSDPALVGATLDATTEIDGVTAAALAAEYTLLNSAWTAWTPTITGSGSNPTHSGSSRYKQIGKNLYLHFNEGFSALGSGTYTITLPNALSALNTATALCARLIQANPFSHGTNSFIAYASGTSVIIFTTGGQLSTGSLLATDILAFDMIVEVA